ncbi:Na+/H+-dicarboxylate symporter [Algoriphagus ornithinivorans]|jgi:proton glutamate symport protein|uniref:Na+/H+-dicarboxylate symporter n=2 Tax=Algoriphagus TaxID=246875 RepID=A0A1I5FSZ8_9BACT|nr:MULTISPECIES: dicarboxylate/amino acid:cation symporter [Algoriphagus]MAL14603.1 dicarboxylate/amino acid:cation symporter [Algoriphagus sp.]MAN87639.1 dicarboxylate/amino acid:cation symporter [Algoriphagus sp.]QYH40646.1 dicarboxylate/amino acid:cation symporter [Algoriphagus sp. NBT04N3]SFO26713.1 Na+/H+-dicarboxylate symporter [Algoriphagus ornithinivorans]HAD53228.1 dicarboxylate/amino acid:cation symporter [Algoriphagus sp.]|tara:strand:+ start:3613 stop:4941 length:1329 start_codon:yes stop_codon:yes gene_type:complete
MRKKIPLHTKIIIGLVLGLVFGLVVIKTNLPNSFTIDYIKPIGTIFINALKMIAVPLVLASLIVGVSNLGDISKLSRIGGKTIGTYLVTTVIAISIGLILVNIFKPGKSLPVETRESLMQLYEGDAGSKVGVAAELQQQSPLQPLVDIVPQNFFLATTDNGAMLQVVFFAIIVGIALLQIPKEKGNPVIAFFDGFNDVIIQIVNYIMMIAPYGVFALMASLIVEIAGDNPDSAIELLLALLKYSLVVVGGLLMMIMVIYPLILMAFTKVKYLDFFKAIRPAQLLAFSTSSSSATLPVTMKQVEEEIGVSEEVSSFVLPLGATVNMDGTSLYQGVAAVFIAQALGMDLSLTQQLMIVLTATLASIGSAGVPGAGLIMLIIVLESIGVPAAGIALIIAPDRILDMFRTVVNVTGDATVCTIVASTEGELPDGLIRKSNPLTPNE